MSWVKEADLPDLPEIFKAISSNGQALELVEQLNEGIAFGSSALTRAQEEAIATAVSVANRCRYGALTHGGFFRKYAGDSGAASQLLADHTQADLSQADHVMLDYAVKVTLDPAALTEQDLQGLRDAGFADEQIVSIVLVTCLFNFMNRIANSLGVAVPAPFARSVETWLTGPAAQETWLLDQVPGQRRGNLSWKGLEKSLGGLSNAVSPQGAGGDTQTGLSDAVPPQRVINRLEAPAEVEEGGISEELPLDSLSGNDTVADPSSTEGVPAISRVSDEPSEEIAHDEALPQDAPNPEESPEGSIEGSEKTDDQAKAAPQLSRFISDCCAVGKEETCTARNLYVAYLRWCDQDLIPPMLQRNFGLGLSEMGYQRRRRSHGQHWWLGLGVNTASTGR